MKSIEQWVSMLSTIEPENREGVITLLVIVSSITLFSLGVAVGRFIFH